METTIIVAIIGAIATVAAAIITLLKPESKSPPKAPTIIDGDQNNTGNLNVTGTGNNVTATGDINVTNIEQEVVLQERFVSKDGAYLITETSKEIISDMSLRRAWSSFDAKFLASCIKDTPRGYVLDGEVTQQFIKPENDSLFGLGVQVYTACCKKISDEANSDYQAFNKIAQIYISARLLLRRG